MTTESKCISEGGGGVGTGENNKKKRRQVFIMHAILRVMSPWCTQSLGFPLMALIKAAVSGSGRAEEERGRKGFFEMI